MRPCGESLGVVVVPTGSEEGSEGEGRGVRHGAQAALFSGGSVGTSACSVPSQEVLEGSHFRSRRVFSGARSRSPLRDASCVTVPLLRSAPPPSLPGSPQLAPVRPPAINPEAGSAASTGLLPDVSVGVGSASSELSLSGGAAVAPGGTVTPRKPSVSGWAAHRQQPDSGGGHVQSPPALRSAGTELPGMVPRGSGATVLSQSKSDAGGDTASCFRTMSGVPASGGGQPAEGNFAVDASWRKCSLSPAEGSVSTLPQAGQSIVAQSVPGGKDVPSNGSPAGPPLAAPPGTTATATPEEGTDPRRSENPESSEEERSRPYSSQPLSDDGQPSADQAQQESEDEAVGTINSLDKLGTVRYVKRPLGTFEKTLTYMKHREFIRKHHGVFGTTSLTSCIWWALGCQFLVMSVGMMTCHRVDADGQKYIRSFLDPDELSGKLSIYFFASLGLTLVLAIRFGGPLMLKWSARLSKLGCTMLLITAPAVQIRESLKGSVICATALYVAPLQLNGMVIFNGIFTQLQLLMFIGSMFNSLFWAKLRAFWFRHHSVKLWSVVKKQNIQLQIPQPIEQSLAGRRPRKHST